MVYAHEIMTVEAREKWPGFLATDQRLRYNSVPRLVITVPGSNDKGTITVNVSWEISPHRWLARYQGYHYEMSSGGRCGGEESG